MKKTKKNNKGFSLVELIVVVLIMAIIAVALAPQVMKWVGKSKDSADVSNYNSLFSNVQLALTEDTTIKTATVTFDNDGVTISSTDASKLSTALNKIAGYKFTSNKSTAIKVNAGGPYKIQVTDGNVIRDTAPEGAAATPSAS